MKKYELTTDCKIWRGKKLYRIRALVDFADVKAGDLGGYLECESNLSYDGDAWVSGSAQVSGKARVSDDAEVSDNAEVSGNAWVSGKAWVSDIADYICFYGFGSEYRCTTMFMLKTGGVGVRCDCFCGTLADFEDKVRETHGESKYAKEYLACIGAAKIHFEV